jgi:G3E family GTPase
MVTVVDTVHFFDNLYSISLLKDRGESLGEDDERSVVDLLVDQIEFANVIILNKISEVESAHLAKVKSVIHALNPDAVCMETNYADVPLDAVLNTGRFDFETASEAPGWLKELRGEHIPETDEYNISSIVFKSRRPLHPERFLNFIQSKLDGVYRIKGYFWLATRMDFVGQIGVAGKLCQLSPAGKWWAAVPKAHWDLDDPEFKDAITQTWQDPYGDRRQEFVLIGTDINESDLRRRLDACLLTESELVAGPMVWQGYADPIQPWEFIETPEETLETVS